MPREFPSIEQFSNQAEANADRIKLDEIIAGEGVDYSVRVQRLIVCLRVFGENFGKGNLGHIAYIPNLDGPDYYYSGTAEPPVDSE
jgi:hypothetical protein